MVGLVYEHIYAEDRLREFFQTLFVYIRGCVIDTVWLQDGPLSGRFGLTKLAALLELEPEAKTT